MTGGEDASANISASNSLGMRPSSGYNLIPYLLSNIPFCVLSVMHNMIWSNQCSVYIHVDMFSSCYALYIMVI
jgi:hypothetical protein